MKDICAIFLILGSVIGAGFATGREIVVFYVNYGLMGAIGIGFSSVLFILMFYKYLSCCPNVSAKNKYNNVILICYIIISGGLIDACGEINTKVLGVGFNIIGLITIMLVGVLVLFDIDKISKFCFYIVPSLIIISILISLLGVWNNINADTFVINNSPIEAFIKSILYVGINTLMVSSVLFDVGTKIRNKKLVSICCGVAFGAIVLILAIFIYCGGESVINSTIPVYVLSCRAGVIWKYLYLLSLWLAIFSSLISTIYGIQNCLKMYIGNKLIRVLLSVVICYIVSLIGFDNIVSVLYPLIGCIGLIYYTSIFKHVNV